MIPARIGSQRLKLKNLAMLNGKPLIYYAIEAAKKSEVFDEIIINSDHKIFSEIADRYSVNFYLRPKKLGSSLTKSDEVVADFMEKNKSANIVAWVNSIAPLQQPEEISKIINYFIDNKFHSLITVNEKQVHCIYDNIPINYDPNSPFALTQDLKPVMAFVYSLMIWERKNFLKEFRKNGQAIINGKFGTYVVSNFSSLIIKNKDDLRQAEFLIKSKSISSSKSKIKYDSLSKKLS